MRLLGNLTDYLKSVFKKDGQDITLRPNQSTTYTAARDIQLPPGDAAHVIVSASSTQTLTNKTIDADGAGNSITNIENADIKAGAAIDAAKIANGTISNAEFQQLNGVTSTLVGISDTNTLTNKTIDADLNTISNLAHGAEVDDLSSGVHGVTGTVVGTSDTQTLTNKTFDADLNTVSNIDNADIKVGANIDAAKLGTGAVSTTELNRLDGILSTAVGISDTNTLTNKTIDADNNTISNLAHGSEVDNPSSGVHGVTGSVVGTTDTQTLSSKSFSDNINLLTESAVRFQDTTGGEYVGLKAPATVTSYTVSLPDAAPSTGQVLSASSATALIWGTTLTNPMDSDGDLIIGGASGAATKLDHPGAANYVVASTGASTTAWTDSPTVNSATVVGNLTVDTDTLVVDSTNNRVGIGETTPTARLHVKATSNSVTDYPTIVKNNAGSVTSGFGAYGATSTHGYTFDFGTSIDQPFSFQGNGTDLLTIERSGHIGIHKANPSRVLDIIDDGSVGANISAALTKTTALADGNNFGFYLYNNTVLTLGMSVWQDGAATSDSLAYLFMRADTGTGNYLYYQGSTLYTTTSAANLGTAGGTVVGEQVTSDERLKTNIVPLDYGLSTALQLSPIRYEMLGEVEIGFGAQTTEGIVPEAVKTTADRVDPLDEESPADKRVLSYIRIVPILVNAIKELKAENDALEARVTALETP